MDNLKLLYSPEEYLSLEETATFKSEYRDGEIVPMTGGTANHNNIAGNFYARFLFALEAQNYNPYIGDVRLWVSRYRQYVYPDVMVVRGESVYQDDSKTTILNPCLIVEVLSRSTKNYDQGDKFDYYRSIPEIREYLLIDQYRFYVQQFAKNTDDNWVLRELEGEEAILRLETIDFQISFHHLYQRVDFETEN